MQDEKVAWNFYDAGTIAFYYTVLNYLYSAANQETSLTESFLEQAFNTHMSQFEETTNKSEFKVPISEPKSSKINFTDLISKTKINSPSTPSPMKSQRLMQRRKQVSYFITK